MLRSISALPTWLIGAVLLVVLPAIVVLVQWGIRRRWPALKRGEQNDVVGFVIAVVGVIYAVLLAFVVIVAWENFDEAEQIVGQEASTLRGTTPDVRASWKCFRTGGGGARRGRWSPPRPPRSR